MKQDEPIALPAAALGTARFGVLSNPHFRLFWLSMLASTNGLSRIAVL